MRNWKHLKNRILTVHTKWKTLVKKKLLLNKKIQIYDFAWTCKHFDKLLIFLICGEDFGLSDNSLTSQGIQTLSYRFARWYAAKHVYYTMHA